MRNNLTKKSRKKVYDGIGFLELEIPQKKGKPKKERCMGFFLTDEHFLSYTNLLDKATNIRVKPKCSFEVRVPDRIIRDETTGITVFRIEKIDGVRPLQLQMNFNPNIATIVYLPWDNLLKKACGLIPWAIRSSSKYDSLSNIRHNAPCEASAIISQDVITVPIGCPVLDESGSVVGIVAEKSRTTHRDMAILALLTEACAYANSANLTQSDLLSEIEDYISKLPLAILINCFPELN